MNLQLSIYKLNRDETYYLYKCKDSDITFWGEAYPFYK
jgi:hypothetical protein